MGKVALERLQINQERQFSLPAEVMAVQIGAVKRLVAAARVRLEDHRIDRDVGTGLPVANKRYDAFFKIPETGAVMLISTVGLSPDGPLFVHIHSKDQDVVSKIVSLQTVKNPHLVTGTEALWLSSYSPDQLELLSNIITEAEPTDKASYEEYIMQDAYL